MGVTYLAYDPQLRVEVALKVINPAQVSDATARSLFLREARAAARVHQSNVANVVFLSEDPSNPFYAMEFIAGEALRDWLKPRSPLDPALAIGLALQIARGLEAIHRENVVHRDLKPTNLMVLRADATRRESDPEAWQIKIIDFGLARRVAADVEESSDDAATIGFRGTARYASPEQCEERRDLDGRSDLYSLGCVLWEMLVGAPPFREGAHQAMLNAHIAKPPPLQQLSHLPTSLQAVMARLLIKDREARFANAGALIKALEASRERVERGEKGSSNAYANSQLETDPTIESAPVTNRREPGSVPRVALRRFVWPVGLALAFAVAAIVLVMWNGWFPLASAAFPIVAVLPFDAQGGSKDDEQLADGLTTELISRLSQLPTLQVISRGSVSGYRLTPGSPRKRIREIGRELRGVRAVLEGSVRRTGDKLKIDVILYDASTEKRLWGEAFDRKWKDVFAIQAEVAEQIALALKSRISIAERQRLLRPTTDNMTAYDLFVRGIEELGADEMENKTLLERAVELDPRFAEAHAYLALFHLRAYNRSIRGSEDAKEFEAAEANARKAVELDPECIPGLLILAEVAQRQGMVAQTQELIRRALKLAPSDLRANIEAARTAKIEGRYDEWYFHARRTDVLAPGNFTAELQNGVGELGLLDLMDHWTKRALELSTDSKERAGIEINVLIKHRDFAAILDRIRIDPDIRESGWIAFYAQNGLRDWDAALVTTDRLMSQETGNPETLAAKIEVLWALRRTKEAKDVAAKLLEANQKARETAKKKGLRDRSIYRREAISLQVLGRDVEAATQLELWDKSNSPAADLFMYETEWQALFRANPEAQVILDRMRQKYELMARRVQEIEKSYSDKPSGPKM